MAALFDSVLSQAPRLAGRAGMTGTLTVRYHLPTPLDRELAFEARLLESSGRKSLARATLEAEGVLCAEAVGLFIAPRQAGVEVEDRP